MLARCLQSCIDQTWPEIEIIYVDNNSTDASPDVALRMAAESGRTFRLSACATPGQAHARNHGYGLASGNFIQWLDADDELRPEKIARQVAALTAAPEVDIVMSDWDFGYWKDDQVTVYPGRSRGPYDDELANLLFDYWRPPHAYLLRRAAADRVQALGGWNADAGVCDDREYFTTHALLGARFLHVPGVLARYSKWSPDQATANRALDVRAAGLARMFDRFRKIARTNGVALDDAHRVALDVDWRFWNVPACGLAVVGAGGAAGAGIRVENPANGHAADIAVPRALEILGAMQVIRADRALTHEFLVTQMRNRVPALKGRDVDLYRFLTTLGEAGVMVPA